MKLTINTSLHGVAALFLCLTLASVGSVYYLLRGMASDSRVVNYAGIVRGGTQGLIKLEMAGKASDQLQAKLDKIVHGLVQGDTDLRLPKATDTLFLQRMEAVSKSWSGLKSLMAAARTDAAQRAALLSASESFFQATDEAVAAAESFGAGKVAHLKHLQMPTTPKKPATWRSKAALPPMPVPVT